MRVEAHETAGHAERVAGAEIAQAARERELFEDLRMVRREFLRDADHVVRRLRAAVERYDRFLSETGGA